MTKNGVRTDVRPSMWTSRIALLLATACGACTVPTASGEFGSERAMGGKADVSRPASLVKYLDVAGAGFDEDGFRVDYEILGESRDDGGESRDDGEATNVDPVLLSTVQVRWFDQGRIYDLDPGDEWRFVIVDMESGQTGEWIQRVVPPVHRGDPGTGDEEISLQSDESGLTEATRPWVDLLRNVDVTSLRQDLEDLCAWRDISCPVAAVSCPFMIGTGNPVAAMACLSSAPACATFVKFSVDIGLDCYGRPVRLTGWDGDQSEQWLGAP